MKRKMYLVMLVTVLAFAAFVATVSADARPSGVLWAIPQQSGLVGAAPHTAQAPEAPEGSGFTYQGRLKDGNGPANGSYDLQFTLYDASSGGNVAGGPIILLNQTVTDGLFTVQLDFGSSAIQGSALWMEIAVRQAGGGTYTTLSPRQALTATPYAMSLMPGAGIIGSFDYAPALAITNTSSVGIGVYGSGNGAGLYGTAGSGYGVYGSGGTSGVFGETHNVYGSGVEGYNTTNGTAVYGYAPNESSTGVYGDGGSFGVYAMSSSLGGAGVYGLNNSNIGVYGGGNFGVYGIGTNTGVYGQGSTWAGYFNGNVRITGSCCAAEQGTYQIDDPLDPANKYLNQAAVQSSETKDIYDGVANLDANGEATVTMPAWFQALNRDFRYQLTAIGAPAPDLYVAQEIQDNQFKIAGGKSGMKVSWQVTGVSQDPYTNDHPLQVEQPKPSDEQGTYLYPKGYGQPDSKGVDYERQQKLKTQTPPTPPIDSPHGK